VGLGCNHGPLTVPIYVYYQGRLIEKRYKPAEYRAQSDLPAPALHNFEAFASPIDDRPIRSPRERDRDLRNSGSYDPRDTPAAWKRARDVRYQQRRRLAAPEP
jgi:hypothetical protein